MCPARFVCTKGSMNPSNENRILTNYEYIKSEIDALELLDDFVTMKVFSIDDAEAVRISGGKRKRNQACIDLLLNRGPAAYHALIKALGRTGYRHVAQRIEQDIGTDNEAGDTADDFFGKTFRELNCIRTSVNQLETNMMSMISPNRNESSTNVVIVQKSELNKLKGELLAKETEVKLLRETLKNKERRLNEALDEIASLKATVSALEKTCSGQKLLMRDMNITITCNENELKKHERLVYQHEADIESQNSEIKELSDTIDNQRGAIARQAKDIEFLRDVEGTQERKILEIQEENKEQKETLTRQKELLDGQRMRLDQQRNELSEQEKRVSSLEQNGQQKERKIKEQRTRLTAQTELVEHQKNIISESHRQMMSQQKEIESHEQTIENLQEVAKKQANKLENQGELIHQQGEAIRDLQNAVGGIRRRDGNTKVPKWRY